MRTVSAGFIIMVLLCPSVAVGQIFGKGARTEFISGFGLRTFVSVQERNRLLVDGTEVPNPSEREFHACVTPRRDRLWTPADALGDCDSAVRRQGAVAA